MIRLRTMIANALRRDRVRLRAMIANAFGATGRAFGGPEHPSGAA